MKTEWDYTELAEAYLKRPEYSPQGLAQIYHISGLKAQDKVCDIGAGVAHLTLPLAAYGCIVDAVEPNDAMRALGSKRTAHLQNVTWYEGTGEETGRPSQAYTMVTFGSSFNVCDRAKALAESHRLLKPQGHFACMWNHRDLEDPIQKAIEDIIRSHIADYGYGTRRENQRAVIESSHLFKDVQEVEGQVKHQQSITEVVEAWRSHATLHRQAGEAFPAIIADIERMLQERGQKEITIPYTTRIWIAQKA